MIWKADVTQIQVTHRKYYNRVFLSIYKNKVILEGTETAGEYLQISDLDTGKKLFDHTVFEIQD